ncbi:sugar transferase [Betaproteobacteria bacterium]|nr:sugar transferase [Betaproteobacteria bacterium]GHU04842.1 sugar transferase [Betaproteobacteria bacterium]GHU22723.1 sugar transferase [Betaproteobacteria bacterium]
MLKVLGHYLPWHVLARIALDLVLLIVGVVALVVFRGEQVGPHWNTLLLSATVFSFVMVAVNFATGIYRPVVEDTLLTAVARVVLALVFVLPVAYGLVLSLPWTAFATLSMQLAAVLLTVVVLVLRALVNRSQVSSLFAPHILILGVGEEAAAVQRTLLHPEQGRVAAEGFFPASHDETRAVDADKIITDEPLLSAVKRLGIDEIIVAIHDLRGSGVPQRELLDCKLAGVQVFDLSTFYERVERQVKINSLRAGWLIYGDGFRQGVDRVIAKRCFDLFFSLLLLLASVPIMLVTALLIVLEDRGPVFYRQERVGLGGEVFKVIKFRSMRIDAEKDGKPRWATSNDDRVTRVGRVIRKLRIDELPQLFNVLDGDMSLVGPRPERPFFVDQLADEIPFYGVRHCVKPGVTGWAQVRYQYGASVDDAVQKLQYDLYYVKNHTLLLDTLVLLETVRVVLTGAGAH